MLDTVSNFRPASERRVVLLDAAGRSAGTAPKGTVHDRDTPLHLAFSCHVIGPDGRWLLTRRSPSKRTFPSVWTNACCGHPQPGETLREAVIRHLADELSLRPRRMALAIGDFAYRAEAADGTVEHELCPVVVAEVDHHPEPDPDEADAIEWIEWEALVDRARGRAATLSPWSVAQLVRLSREMDVDALLAGDDPADRLLDVVPGSVGRRTRTEDPSLATSSRLIEQRLADFIAAPGHEVGDDAGALGVLHAAISELTAAGGKRLRPAFVLWGGVAAGGDLDSPAALDAAASVELLHTFALLHDDVMDRSDTRRGRPTAQHTLSRFGADEGDAAWFGVSAAVLAGDLAFVWADQLFDASSTDTTSEHHREARRLYTLLRTEVIAGQYLDLHAGCSADTTEEDASRIALLKSARYTVTRPLQIGGALAGAGPTLLEQMARYGDATGMAFQLRDDVLGMFGDPHHTGKSCADDLREGKRTLLLLRAMALTTAAGRAVLDGALGRPDLDEVSAQRCRDVIADSGALASIEAAIDVHLERAVAAASSFAHGAAGPLTELAELAARRDC